MRSVLFTALLLLDTLAVSAACPTVPPDGSIGFKTLCSTSSRNCPNGPVSFQFFSVDTGGPPGPSPYKPAYKLQACDSVSWDFGDGTTQTVIGSGEVTHDFPLPGNYSVRMTVTNALGSISAVQGSIVIATSPSRLWFDTETASLEAGILGAQPVTYPNIVVAREGSGAFTVVVERSLDLSRTITAVAHIDAPPGEHRIANVAVPLTFLPGETQKSFSVPIANDDVFSGPRFCALSFDHVTGGALPSRSDTSGPPELLIVDDEPRPVLSMSPRTISIREGDRGSTPIPLGAELSAPLAFDFFMEGFSLDLTAKAGDDFDFFGVFAHFGIGETSTILTSGAIKGDTNVEPDEQFKVRLFPRSSFEEPSVGVIETVVTILNDDAAFVPAARSLSAGNTTTLKLDLGSPYATPTTIAFQSTKDGVVSIPQSVTVPAGVSAVDVRIAAVSGGTTEIRATAPDRTVQPATITVSAPRQRSARH
jgi:PKD repeat protein